MLKLNKPIAFIDLETTGVNVVSDRIVEISVLKIMPDGEQTIKTRRINPGIPIPKAATAIHGISDDDVKDAPKFVEIAKSLYQWLGNSDIAGYNSNKFDVPMLIEEFLRAGIDFDLKNRRLVDVQNIFHKMEQRTLKAAYKFYCEKDLENAHSAEADIKATYEVLLAQIKKYEGKEYIDSDGSITKPIKNDIQALHDFSYNHRFADLVGHIVYNEQNKEVLNFGKHKGKEVEEVFKTEPSYYDWMMKGEFPLYTKKIITAIKLRGASNVKINTSK